MEKTESKITYDDRRKELTHQVDEEREVKSRDGQMVVGTETVKRIEVFKEKGIRKIISDLQNEEVQLKENIKECEKEFLELQDVEETEEVKKFKEIINKKQIQELIPKLRKKEQLQANLELLNKNLKKTKKDLNQIKETIGTRLKL